MDNDKDLLQKLMDEDKDYQEFWKNYKPDEIRFPNRKRATYRLWRTRIPATQKAMLAYVTEKSVPKWKNPYFFVQEFSDPDPEFLSGAQQEKNWKNGIPMVQVKVGNRFLICTTQTQQDFNLPFVKPWPKKED